MLGANDAYQRSDTQRRTRDQLQPMRGPESERLLATVAEGCEVDGPSQAMIEQGEELDHGVDLIEVLRHRKYRDLGFEGLEPRRAHRQMHALAFDLGRLGGRSLDLAEFRVVRTKPLPRALPLEERVADGRSNA